MANNWQRYQLDVLRAKAATLRGLAVRRAVAEYAEMEPKRPAADPPPLTLRDDVCFGAARESVNVDLLEAVRVARRMTDETVKQ